MKRYLKYCAILLMLLLVVGCATTKLPVGNSQYVFSFDGRSYSISSINPDNRVGYNLLIMKEGDKIVMTAVDKEQDGTIDQIMRGSWSIKEAQSIYTAGIEAGRKNGTLRKRYVQRSYETNDSQNHYILETYELAMGEIYNKLVIYNRNTPFFQTILRDINADGILNKMDKDGDQDIEYYQSYYQDVLKRGMGEGRVVKSNGRYVVALK